MLEFVKRQALESPVRRYICRGGIMELRKEKQSRGEGILVQLSNNHLVRDIAILCMLLGIIVWWILFFGEPYVC
jgi:hypothetical protein